jgi:hypothetical protein
MIGLIIVFINLFYNNRNNRIIIMLRILISFTLIMTANFVVGQTTSFENVSETVKQRVRLSEIRLNGSKISPDSLICPDTIHPISCPPKVKVICNKSDTLFIEILNDYYLTQSLGTTGAEMYIDSVANEFLKIETIQFIDFSFSPGDHAEPGVYSKNGYKLK